MNKEQKTAAVAELSDRLKEAESIFAVDYRGISVTGAAELRARLREADASFKVVKNRLAKRAVADAGAEGLDDLLVGPTALTLIKGDPVTAAKAISTFARERDVLSYKGGIMDGEPLDPDAFAAIARLPALEVLHGQLVGLTASPLTGLARGLGSMLSGLAIALGQISDQGLVSGEEPEAPAGEEPEAPVAAEAPSEDEPADEPAEEGGTPEPTAETEEPPAEPEASEETENDQEEQSEESEGEAAESEDQSSEEEGQ